jgi:hypothetical protein
LVLQAETLECQTAGVQATWQSKRRRVLKTCRQDPHNIQILKGAAMTKANTSLAGKGCGGEGLLQRKQSRKQSKLDHI